MISCGKEFVSMDEFEGGRVRAWIDTHLFLVGFVHLPVGGPNMVQVPKETFHNHPLAIVQP